MEVASSLSADGGFPVHAEEGRSGGISSGSGVGSAPVSSSADEWELVVCQELAVEGKFTFKVSACVCSYALSFFVS